MLNGRMKIHCTKCGDHYWTIPNEFNMDARLGFCQPCVISGAAEAIESAGDGPRFDALSPSETPAAPVVNPTSPLVAHEGTGEVSPARDIGPDPKTTDAPGSDPSRAGASTNEDHGR